MTRQNTETVISYCENIHIGAILYRSRSNFEMCQLYSPTSATADLAYPTEARPIWGVMENHWKELTQPYQQQQQQPKPIENLEKLDDACVQPDTAMTMAAVLEGAEEDIGVTNNNSSNSDSDPQLLLLQVQFFPQDMWDLQIPSCENPETKMKGLRLNADRRHQILKLRRVIQKRRHLRFSKLSSTSLSSKRRSFASRRQTSCRPGNIAASSN